MVDAEGKKLSLRVKGRTGDGVTLEAFEQSSGEWKALPYLYLLQVKGKDKKHPDDSDVAVEVFGYGTLHFDPRKEDK